MYNTIGKAWRKAGWRDIGSDMSWECYGGKWAKQDPQNSQVWYVVDYDWADMADGHDYTGGRCIAEVRMVDLATVDADARQSALNCCGLDLDDIKPEHRDCALVECCVSYGNAAPMGSHSGTHPLHVRAAALRDAESMMSDPERTETLLARPVNALGSTAREFAAGDFQSAMERGVHSGDMGARITAKMHGIPQDAIDNARPDDFLPYLMGYMSGHAGAEPEQSDDLAPEYTQGYERGKRVAAGEAPRPEWIKHEQAEGMPQPAMRGVDS